MDSPSPVDLQTQLEVVTEALRRSEERAVAGQLALEVMHEVRSPREALTNLIYLISFSAEDPQQVRAYVQTGRRADRPPWPNCRPYPWFCKVAA